MFYVEIANLTTTNRNYCVQYPMNTLVYGGKIKRSKVFRWARWASFSPVSSNFISIILKVKGKGSSCMCLVLSNLFRSFAQSTETTKWLTIWTWMFLASNQFIEPLFVLLITLVKKKVNWKMLQLFEQQHQTID